LFSADTLLISREGVFVFERALLYNSSMKITPVPSTLVHSIVPPGSHAREPYPALVFLHGRGADEKDLLGLAPFFDPGVLIVSVRAPFQFPAGGWTWYDLQEVGNPHQQQFSESYDRLEQFLADVKKHYPVDSKRIFLFGFSMGAVMSYAVSLTRPEAIAGVVAHSGYIPEHSSLRFALDKLQNSSFFVAHGIHDPVIPVQLGRHAKELLTRTKARLEYHEYPIAHQISQESIADGANWLKKNLEKE
jgi:phospholipase/carboxylesterase